MYLSRVLLRKYRAQKKAATSDVTAHFSFGYSRLLHFDYAFHTLCNRILIQRNQFMITFR